jgi:hypothetical protein
MKILIPILIGLTLLASALPTACTVDGDVISKDLVTPEMTDQEPAAGRRVRQVAPEYVGTDVITLCICPRIGNLAANIP